MNPALSHRVAVAWDEVRVLGAAEAERYLHQLRQSDPEVASQLDVLLRVQGPPDRESDDVPSHDRPPGQLVESPAGRPDELAHASHGEPTIPKDAKLTAAWPQRDAPAASEAVCAGPTTGSRIVGRFHLLRVVGRGGFGEVWQAYDPILEKHVAVKVPRSRHPDNSPLRAAFIPEARKAASLRHPAIVQVYDVGQGEDGWYIVSEFVDGESLRERLKAGRLPFDRVARIIATVATALHVAHLAGLIHRDVKPANVLLDRTGNAYLTDFGLAVSEEEQLAERSKVSGTLAYMSPEQISGDTHLMDGRADIYALGAVLYELLTGRPLFRAGNLEEYRELILRREPRPPRSIDDTIPEGLERVCLKCLAKEVRQRYATAQDLANDLNAWLTTTARPPAEPAGPPTPVPGWLKPAVAAALALSLVGSAVGVAVLSGILDGGRTPPAPTGMNAETAPGGDQGRKPTVKELLWPGGRDVSKWEILPETNRLKVSTDSAALLQIGETDADSWDFGATLRRLHGTGQRGLFLGYRRDTQTLKATFELIRLVENGDKTYLQRSLETYRFDAPSVTLLGHTTGTVLMEDVRPENSLRLVIRGSRLREVRFNGKPVPKLFDVPLDSAAAGPFGAFNQNLEGIVSDPLFNDTPIPLLDDGRRPSPEKP